MMGGSYCSSQLHHNRLNGFCRVVVGYLFDFYSKHLLYISSDTVIVVKYLYFITWNTIIFVIFPFIYPCSMSSKILLMM